MKRNGLLHFSKVIMTFTQMFFYASQLLRKKFCVLTLVYKHITIAQLVAVTFRIIYVYRIGDVRPVR